MKLPMCEVPAPHEFAFQLREGDTADRTGLCGELPSHDFAAGFMEQDG